MGRRIVVGKVCLAAIALLAGNAQAGVIYSNDFQSAVVGQEWASTSPYAWGTQSTPVPADSSRKFLGYFGGNDVTTLAVSGIPGDTTKIRLEFDAYLIWSWDGNDTRQINNIPLGPDVFGFRNEQMEQSWTFSQGVGTQSYCDSGMAACVPTTGAVERYTLGYRFEVDPITADIVTTKGAPMDSVYHFVWEGLHTGPSTTFEFFSKGLQVRTDLPFPYMDEAWGLDNVRISAFSTSIVEPSTLWLMLAGGLSIIMFSIARHHGSMKVLPA